MTQTLKRELDNGNTMLAQMNSKVLVSATGGNTSKEASHDTLAEIVDKEGYANTGGGGGIFCNPNKSRLDDVIAFNEKQLSAAQRHPRTSTIFRKDDGSAGSKGRLSPGQDQGSNLGINSPPVDGEIKALLLNQSSNSSSSRVGHGDKRFRTLHPLNVEFPIRLEINHSQQPSVLKMAPAQSSNQKVQHGMSGGYEEDSSPQQIRYRINPVNEHRASALKQYSTQQQQTGEPAKCKSPRSIHMLQIAKLEEEDPKAIAEARNFPQRKTRTRNQYMTLQPREPSRMREEKPSSNERLRGIKNAQERIASPKTDSIEAEGSQITRNKPMSPASKSKSRKIVAQVPQVSVVNPSFETVKKSVQAFSRAGMRLKRMSSPITRNFIQQHQSAKATNASASDGDSSAVGGPRSSQQNGLYKQALLTNKQNSNVVNLMESTVRSHHSRGTQLQKETSLNMARLSFNPATLVLDSKTGGLELDPLAPVSNLLQDTALNNRAEKSFDAARQTQEDGGIVSGINQRQNGRSKVKVKGQMGIGRFAERQSIGVQMMTLPQLNVGGEGAKRDDSNPRGSKLKKRTTAYDNPGMKRGTYDERVTTTYSGHSYREMLRLGGNTTSQVDQGTMMSSQPTCSEPEIESVQTKLKAKITATPKKPLQVKIPLTSVELTVLPDRGQLAAHDKTQRLGESDRSLKYERRHSTRMQHEDSQVNEVTQGETTVEKSLSVEGLVIDSQNSVLNNIHTIIESHEQDSSMGALLMRGTRSQSGERWGPSLIAKIASSFAAGRPYAQKIAQNSKLVGQSGGKPRWDNFDVQITSTQSRLGELTPQGPAKPMSIEVQARRTMGRIATETIGSIKPAVTQGAPRLRNKKLPSLGQKLYQRDSIYVDKNRQKYLYANMRRIMQINDPITGLSWHQKQLLPEDKSFMATKKGVLPTKFKPKAVLRSYDEDQYVLSSPLRSKEFKTIYMKPGSPASPISSDTGTDGGVQWPFQASCAERQGSRLKQQMMSVTMSTGQGSKKKITEAELQFKERRSVQESGDVNSDLRGVTEIQASREDQTPMATIEDQPMALKMPQPPPTKQHLHSLPTVATKVKEWLEGHESKDAVLGMTHNHVLQYRTVGRYQKNHRNNKLHGKGLQRSRNVFAENNSNPKSRNSRKTYSLEPSTALLRVRDPSLKEQVTLRGDQASPVKNLLVANASTAVDRRSPLAPNYTHNLRSLNNGSQKRVARAASGNESSLLETGLSQHALPNSKNTFVGDLMGGDPSTVSQLSPRFKNSLLVNLPGAQPTKQKVLEQTFASHQDAVARLALVTQKSASKRYDNTHSPGGKHLQPAMHEAGAFKSVVPHQIAPVIVHNNSRTGENKTSVLFGGQHSASPIGVETRYISPTKELMTLPARLDTQVHLHAETLLEPSPRQTREVAQLSPLNVTNKSVQRNSTTAKDSQSVYQVKLNRQSTLQDGHEVPAGVAAIETSLSLVEGSLTIDQSNEDFMYSRQGEEIGSPDVIKATILQRTQILQPKAMAFNSIDLSDVVPEQESNLLYSLMTLYSAQKLIWAKYDEEWACFERDHINKRAPIPQSAQFLLIHILSAKLKHQKARRQQKKKQAVLVNESRDAGSLLEGSIDSMYEESKHQVSLDAENQMVSEQLEIAYKQARIRLQSCQGQMLYKFDDDEHKLFDLMKHELRITKERIQESLNNATN